VVPGSGSTYRLQCRTAVNAGDCRPVASVESCSLFNNSEGKGS